MRVNLATLAWLCDVCIQEDSARAGHLASHAPGVRSSPRSADRAAKVSRDPRLPRSLRPVRPPPSARRPLDGEALPRGALASGHRTKRPANLGHSSWSPPWSRRSV